MNRKDNDKGVSGEAFAKFFKIGIISLVVLAVIAVGLMVIPPFIKTNVASVGPEKVRDYEFKFYLKQLKSSMFSEAQKNNPNLKEDQFWSTPIKGENAIDVAKKDVLETIKEIKIQVNKAKAAGIKLEKNDLDYVNSILGSMVSSSLSKEKQDADSMEYFGVTFDQVKEIYSEQYLVGKFRDKQIEDMKLTQADIKTFYEKYPDKYKTFDYRPDGGEAVWARHILIKIDTSATDADKEAARKKAQEVLDKIKGGADFTAMVKEYSEDTGSNQTGGSYVISKEAGFDTAFENAAFALNPGEVSDLVLGTYGYHIIKVEEKYAKDVPVSLKCAQESTNLGLEYVKDQKYQLQLDGWKKDTAYDAKITNKSVYDSL